MKILIVDHSPMYREILQQGLQGYGQVTITLAASAADALIATTEEHFNFLIISGQLPDGDGMELARSLRLNGQVPIEPIVILTGSPSAAMNREAEMAGVSEIFRKGDIAELAIFLRRFLAVFGKITGRVLYVEDAPDQRLLLGTQMREWGLVVKACNSAEEAWQAYVQGEFDVLVTDLVLGEGMSGARLVNRIRRLPGPKGDLPILALTAFDTPTRRTALFHLGVDDYAGKPVVGIELRARLQRLIAQRRDEANLQASETRFLGIAAQLPLVVRIAAADRSRICYVSPAYEAIWQQGVQSLYGASSSWAWFDAVHSDDRQRVLDAAMATADGSYQEEYRIVLPDGTIRWIRDHCFLLSAPWEGLPCVAGIAEEITALRNK